MNRSFFIAGVQFRPREEINEAIKEIKVGDRLSLVPEPSNKFDPNATRIEFSHIAEGEGSTSYYVFLGYVPKKFSSEVSALLEVEVDLECIVEEINPAAKPWEMCKVVVKEVEK